MNISILKKFKLQFVLGLGFLISMFLTYNYTDFYSNSSLGVGYSYTAKSLVLERNFDVNEYKTAAGADVFRVNDNSYVAYPPLNSIILAIPYFLLQVVYYFYTNYVGSINGDFSLVLESLALSLPSSIAYVAIGYLVFKVLMEYKVEEKIAVWGVVGLLFGTILLNYSVSFIHHPVSAFFVFYSFFLLKSYKRSNYFYAGLFVGLAFLTEFPTVLFCVGVGVREFYLLKQSKVTLRKGLSNLVCFAIPVAFCIFLLGFFHWYHYGDPFLFAERLLSESRQSLGKTVHGFTQNPLLGLFGLYFSPIKGLFLISPFLLYAFLGLKKFFLKDSSYSILILSYIVFLSLLYSMWSDCFGANVFGPRYLISLLPFFLLLSVFGVGKSILLYKVLVIYGILICFLVVLSGLPSGSLFGECNIFIYAAYFKVNAVWGEILAWDFEPASVVLRYLLEKSF